MSVYCDSQLECVLFYLESDMLTSCHFFFFSTKLFSGMQCLIYIRLLYISIIYVYNIWFILILYVIYYISLLYVLSYTIYFYLICDIIYNIFLFYLWNKKCLWKCISKCSLHLHIEINNVQFAAIKTLVLFNYSHLFIVIVTHYFIHWLCHSIIPPTIITYIHYLTHSFTSSNRFTTSLIHSGYLTKCSICCGLLLLSFHLIIPTRMNNPDMTVIVNGAHSLITHTNPFTPFHTGINVQNQTNNMATWSY